jgi:hypothetical protein
MPPGVEREKSVVRRAHAGRVALLQQFKDVHHLLSEIEQVELTTAHGGRFIARAGWERDGLRGTQAMIRFLVRGVEAGRVYRCCWGHETSCAAKPVGEYCVALDEWE